MTTKSEIEKEDELLEFRVYRYIFCQYDPYIFKFFIFYHLEIYIYIYIFFFINFDYWIVRGLLKLRLWTKTNNNSRVTKCEI